MVDRRPLGPSPPCQVAYGLTEDQMRRWGLYVSRPLGPEESINLFSGGRRRLQAAPVCTWLGSAGGAVLAEILGRRCFDLGSMFFCCGLCLRGVKQPNAGP